MRVGMRERGNGISVTEKPLDRSDPQPSVATDEKGLQPEPSVLVSAPRPAVVATCVKPTFPKRLRPGHTVLVLNGCENAQKTFAYKALEDYRWGGRWSQDVHRE